MIPRGVQPEDCFVWSRPACPNNPSLTLKGLHTVDGERAYYDRKRLVFVVNEAPFEIPASGTTHVNRFSVLLPLMSVDGERCETGESAFPNRGRVWWLIRDSILTEQVTPGSIWTAPLEFATKYDPQRPDNDKFQVKIHDVQPPGNDLLEILNLAEDDPDPARVQRSLPMAWSRSTTPRVFLAGRRTVIGPVRAMWNGSKKQLKFEAIAPTPGAPAEIIRLPLEVFHRLVRVERFDVRIDHPPEGAPDGHLRIELTRSNWFDLDELRLHGQVLDGSTDNQIVNWAARLAGIPRSQTQPLKDLVATLEGDAVVSNDEINARKLDRLRQIAADTQRVRDLSEEVARELAKHSEVFAKLVEQHADKLVVERVEAEVRRREAEIELQIAAKQHQLAQLEAQLREERDRHRHALDEDRKRLEAELQQQRDQLAAQHRELDTREQQVRELEEGLETRLNRVIERYDLESNRFGEDLLAAWPILRKLGFPAGGAPAIAGAVATASPNGLAAPGWIAPPFGPPAATAPVPLAVTDAADVEGPSATTSHSLPATSFPHVGASGLVQRLGRRVVPGEQLPNIDEAAFLNHFESLVAYRGFMFRREDLINFHVTVKCGGLTILAGPTGTGKSSLPRLYAEALGWERDYLHVPVRPDWLDDRDLIGAFNVLAQRFEPASCGLIERLIAAEEDRKQGGGAIFLIGLDEMNLARVEHYFAQFLSVLELPPDLRGISLFAPGQARPDDPYFPHQRVSLGENLRFLGTVNIDETTHFFSPKVLDRSQVVAFSAPDLSIPRKSARTEAPRFNPVSIQCYQRWIRTENDRDRVAASASPPPRIAGLTPPTPGLGRAFVLQLNDILGRSRLGLGYRQFDRILSYVESAKPFFTEDQALDYQISQIILPRLRPTAPHFKETLAALRALVTRDRFPRAADHLERIAEQRAEDDFFQLL